MVDLRSIDVDDVGPPTIKLRDAKHHASLTSSSLSETSLNSGVNEIINFQKLVGNLDKMTIANLGRQCTLEILNSYSKNSWENSYMFGVISCWCIPSILLKVIVYILMLKLLIILYSLNNTTTLCHLSYKWEDNTLIVRLFFVCFPNVSY